MAGNSSLHLENNGIGDRVKFSYPLQDLVYALDSLKRIEDENDRQDLQQALLETQTAQHWAPVLSQPAAERIQRLRQAHNYQAHEYLELAAQDSSSASSRSADALRIVLPLEGPLSEMCQEVQKPSEITFDGTYWTDNTAHSVMCYAIFPESEQGLLRRIEDRDATVLPRKDRNILEAQPLDDRANVELFILSRDPTVTWINKSGKKGLKRWPQWNDKGYLTSGYKSAGRAAIIIHEVWGGFFVCFGGQIIMAGKLLPKTQLLAKAGASQRDMDSEMCLQAVDMPRPIEFTSDSVLQPPLLPDPWITPMKDKRPEGDKRAETKRKNAAARKELRTRGSPAKPEYSDMSTNTPPLQYTDKSVQTLLTWADEKVQSFIQSYTRNYMPEQVDATANEILNQTQSPHPAEEVQPTCTNKPPPERSPDIELWQHLKASNGPANEQRKMAARSYSITLLKGLEMSSGNDGSLNEGDIDSIISACVHAGNAEEVSHAIDELSLPGVDGGVLRLPMDEVVILVDSQQDGLSLYQESSKSPIHNNSADPDSTNPALSRHTGTTGKVRSS